MAPEIPLDLMIDILTRLPAKSLMRFKCVSKLWSCLLRSRYFCNLYLTVASPHRSHRLYMSLNDDHPVEFCQNPDTSALLSLSSCFSNTAESFDQDLIVPGMGGCHMVVLRGLVVYVVCRKACIYNPTTRQSVTLPLPDFKSNLFRHEERIGYSFYFLGHDPVLDQYKVVCTDVTCSKYYVGLTSQHWVFVLKAGGSWERMEFEQPHVPTRRGICISGVIYYLASTPEVHNVVISFDVRSQVFNMIQGPDDLVSAYEFVGVIEYGGKPVIFDYTHLGKTGLVDLWVLEDGGKWSRESLVLQPSQMHLVNKKDIKLTVEGTTQNGEVILAVRPLIYPYYILYYDLQKNDMRKVTIRGIPDHWFGKLSTNVCFSFILINKNESIMYLET